jgi:pimeloyl-ACP methyl ester carboxylesterase
MALDPAPSVYLGRPCYHRASSCEPWDWTLGRYSENVVQSLQAALEGLPQARTEAGVVLIGYSGGGTLAMLLAERIRHTRAVVTLAGNLDSDAWTRHHRLTPLRGSLNPALRPPLEPGVIQLHLLGGRDRQVPPEAVSQAIARQPAARAVHYPDFDHACCWEEVWAAVLGELQVQLTARARTGGG